MTFAACLGAFGIANIRGLVARLRAVLEDATKSSTTFQTATRRHFTGLVTTTTAPAPRVV